MGFFFGIDAMRANLLFVIHILGPQKKKSFLFFFFLKGRASCLCNDIASITFEPINLIRSKCEVIRADYNPNLNGAMLSPRH